MQPSEAAHFLGHRGQPTSWPVMSLLLGITAAALLTGAAVAFSLREAGSRPALTLLSPADKSLGINTDLSRYDPSEQEQILGAIERAGFLWLRQRFAWDQIEPTRGVYNWAPWDEIVAAADRHNLQIIALLDGAPQWSRAADDQLNPLAPPGEVAFFGAFVASLAQRYGRQIDHYQIWDEPNISPHWGAQEINPQAYAGLLREGAIQLRSVDPSAVIFLAALAPNAEPGGANMSDLQFLEALYRHQAAEWFDVVAGQPYDFGEPLDAPAASGELNWSRISLLRKIMETNGDGRKPVWAVSFGVQSMDAAVVSEAVENSRRQWPWLGPMLWAAWAPDDLHGEYALATGTHASSEGATMRGPSPVLDTLAHWSASSNVAWPGSYPANHPSGRYEGSWRVTPLGTDIGRSGDRLTIAFQGTRLDLTVRRGEYRGFLFVTVDGQPANALPLDTDGRSYVVLYDPLEEVSAVTLARWLPDGEHRAQIIAERGWGQWAILGWNVLREEAGPDLWPAYLCGLGAVVAGTITAYRVWPQRGLVLDVYCAFRKRCRGSKHSAWLAPAMVAGATILVWATVGTAPSLLAIGLLALLLVVWPEVGLPLVALALPFYQLGKPLLGKVFSMVEILTLLSLLAWALDWATAARAAPGTGQRTSLGSLARKLTALDWSVLGLLVVGLASLLWAEHGRVAAREFRTVLLEGAAYYGLLRVTASRRRSAWCVVDAWMVGGVLIGLVGLWQWVSGQNLVTAEGVWRVRGFYGSPNNLALYLGRLLPLGVAVAAWYRPLPDLETKQGGKGALWRRWGYTGAALVMAAALLLTYSRGAWMLGVPASLLFLAGMRGRRAFLVVVGTLALVSIVLLAAVGVGRLSSVVNAAEGTTFFRLQLWQSSLSMIREHPLLGLGLDNFLYWYRTRYVLPTAWEEFNLSHPHNLVLDFWLRLGLSGLLMLFWLLVAFFRRGWRAHRLVGKTNQWPLVAGIMAGMVNFVAHGLVDNAFFLVDLAFVFMLMLVLVQEVATVTPSLRLTGAGELGAGSAANPSTRG